MEDTVPEPPSHPGQPPLRIEPDRRPRYRSLRDLTHGARRPPTQTAGASGQPPSFSGFSTTGYQPVHSAPPDAGPQRGRGLRQSVLGALVMLLVIGLVWGGYAAYRYFAPYYGLGYVAGRSGSVEEVVFTVKEARCGLDAAPGKDMTPGRGQFCIVDVTVSNNSPKDRYLTLSMFSVQLDTGSRANPASRVMNTLSLELESGETRDLTLVYDVLDGVRMDSLKVQIGYETSNIPLR